jgi:hypothetical protein
MIMAKTSQHRTTSETKTLSPRNRRRARSSVPPATKAEQITTLLRRPEGATLAEMMKATGWQQHSLRGFMSGTIVKRKGLAITSEKLDGERRYRIVLAGVAA